MKISIVLLNYGCREFVFECLRSIQGIQGRDSCELIFVDNGSPDADWERIEKRLREESYVIDKCLRLHENQGFAAGMNAGADIAEGDWVVMLNSDTVVGYRFVEQIKTAQSKLDHSNVGFIAVPIYYWTYNSRESTRTNRWQADVAALTSYISCMPVRYSDLHPRFTLGPPGPAVVMSSTLIAELKAKYGCIYDPHFFMYGEDVDLFLRAKRLGFETAFIPGDVSRGEVIWHIGSGTSGGEEAALHSIDKDPEIVKRILDGMSANVFSHAGWIELLPLMFIQCLFRFVFYASYARKKSPRALWRLLRVRDEKRSVPSARKHPRPIGIWLSRYIALGRRAPVPWARGSLRIGSAGDYVSTNVS
jgi:GT2 family glycosyltransferase